MNQFNQPPQAIEKKAQDYVALARELAEAHEKFPFPGITQESYSKLKAVAEEFPEYTTPIDELIKKFQAQGMKVVLSTSDPKRGNVHILPFDSQDIEMDNLLPRHLVVTANMDIRLRKLVLANTEIKNK